MEEEETHGARELNPNLHTEGEGNRRMHEVIIMYDYYRFHFICDAICCVFKYEVPF